MQRSVGHERRYISTRVWERHIAEQKRIEEQAQKVVHATQSKSSDLRMSNILLRFRLRLTVSYLAFDQNPLKVMNTVNLNKE